MRVARGCVLSVGAGTWMGAGAGVTPGSPGSSSQVDTSFFWFFLVAPVGAAAGAFRRRALVLREAFLAMQILLWCYTRVRAEHKRTGAKPVQLLASAICVA